MSISVKQFNEEGAKQALKDCPKIVRDYVKILQFHIDNLNDLNAKCINKLKQQAAHDS